MCPIFHPPAVVSPAVRAADAVILAQEGAYHVNGVYLANAADATIARRFEAERRVAVQERHQRLLQTCVWCDRPIAATETPVAIGGRNLHQECADAFDVHTYGESSTASTEAMR